MKSLGQLYDTHVRKDNFGNILHFECFPEFQVGSSQSAFQLLINHLIYHFQLPFEQ